MMVAEEVLASALGVAPGLLPPIVTAAQAGGVGRLPATRRRVRTAGGIAHVVEPAEAPGVVRAGAADDGTGAGHSGHSVAGGEKLRTRDKDLSSAALRGNAVPVSVTVEQRPRAGGASDGRQAPMGSSGNLRARTGRAPSSPHDLRQAERRQVSHESGRARHRDEQEPPCAREEGGSKEIQGRHPLRPRPQALAFRRPLWRSPTLKSGGTSAELPALPANHPSVQRCLISHGSCARRHRRGHHPDAP
jgi:hypothetical protein